MPKLLAIVGGKHSGKTTVIEHLIVELKRRGYRVGTIKDMVRIPQLDTPGKETDRYAQAGAEVIVASPQEETVVFVKKRLSLKEILPYLAEMDFILLEGFECKKTIPKIIAAKTAQEAKNYFDDSVIAISGLITDSSVEIRKALELKIPILQSAVEVGVLAGLVEQEALTPEGWLKQI